jgi:AmiR/NasT family two-component response regulator
LLKIAARVAGDEAISEGLAAEEHTALLRLLNVTAASYEQRAQLERALESRIVIEQAKGVLAERFELGIDDAFGLLRRAARSHHRRLHELAREVVDSRDTPPEVAAALGEARRP